MDASWVGLIGVVVGAVVVSGTTLITETAKRRTEAARDNAERERDRRDALRTVIIRTEAAITALALDKHHAPSLRRAFDEATASELEFGLLIGPEDKEASEAITLAVKGAMRAQSPGQVSWISTAVSEHVPRWYRGEITGHELKEVIGSVTSQIPGKLAKRKVTRHPVPDAPAAPAPPADEQHTPT